MQASDDRILEDFAQEGVDRIKSVDEADLVNYDYETIRRRTKLLSKTPLLDEVGNRVYQIAGEGQEYLAGVPDLRDLEKPD